jgi:RNA polymerase sigma factor (sigma-70 family)
MDKPHPFARVLSSIRPSPGRRATRPGGFTPLVLERLEERCVTAVLSGLDVPVLYAPVPESLGSSGNWAEQAFSWEQIAIGSQPLLGESLVYFPGNPWPVGQSPSGPAPEAAPPTIGGPVSKREPPGPFGHPQPGNGAPATPPPTPREAPVSEPPAPSRPADAEGLTAAHGLARAATPKLSVVLGPAGPDGAHTPQTNVFRITRTPVSEAAVEVRYTLTVHGRAGSVSHERRATIPVGASHVDVPSDAPPSGGQEIVTLTLLENGGYRIARPTGTLFLAGDARCCSEAALLNALQEGRSEEALNALVERNQPAVLRVCHRVLNNWHDAEDVSQMVFLALAQGQVRLHASLAGWLRTVARNAAIVLLRARNRRYRHEHRASKPATMVPEDPAHELREEFDAALAQVCEPLRDAVRLRYLEGWSQIEAAQMIGCPRGTLAQRAALGVRRLGDVLARRDNLSD